VASFPPVDASFAAMAGDSPGSTASTIAPGCEDETGTMSATSG
jgi:hypothetical protein